MDPDGWPQLAKYIVQRIYKNWTRIYKKFDCFQAWWFCSNFNSRGALVCFVMIKSIGKL